MASASGVNLAGVIKCKVRVPRIRGQRSEGGEGEALSSVLCFLLCRALGKAPSPLAHTTPEGLVALRSCRCLEGNRPTGETSQRR